MARLWEEAGPAGAPRPDAMYWRETPIPEVSEDPDWAPPGALTHADLVRRAYSWLVGRHGCLIAFAEIGTSAEVHPDAIGFCRPTGKGCDWSVLVECKLSRSDFRADRNKPIHTDPDGCPGQERWYLTPPGLVSAHEVPEGWGLAEVGARSIRVVAPAPIGDWRPTRARQDMIILAAALRRHQIGVRFDIGTGKFAPAFPTVGSGA